MSKTLYEEALADVRQLKEVAEANAKRAVIDSVTPKIKQLLEAQLFGESDDEVEECDLEESEQFGNGKLGQTDPAVNNGPASVPIDSEEESPEANVEEGFVLTSESASALAGLGGSSVSDKAEVSVFRVVEATNKLVVVPTQTKLTSAYSRKITETIARIEDIYSYLRESSDFSRKGELENRLESCFEVLSAVKESTMRMKDLLAKNTIMEDADMGASDPMAGADAGAPAPEAAPGGKELVMKVTGLPDDVELDKLNIDLISDEGDDMDASAGAPELAAGPTPEAAPMESVEMDDDQEEMVEMDDLDEDDVVEISETMLKRELARLKGKTLAEMDGDVLSAFGGGEDEGEAFLDGEVSTADKDNMVKQSGKTGTVDQIKNPPKGRVAEAKRAIAARKAQVSESSKNEGFKQLAESRAAQIESLRTQLTETNLLNAKLLQANKLLQLEGLSAKQKAHVIDKLDEAASLREVKLVYETLVKTLTDKKTVTESVGSRAVIAGSSSRTTTRSSAQSVQPSGDSYETARWAQLAGIKK